ncbi:9550_t:CDS:2, partial [Ambispora gerdemannii]
MCFQQREAILKNVKLFEIKIPYARYSIAKDEYTEAKKKINSLVQEKEPVKHRREEEKERNKRIARLQAEIVELESIVNEPPPEEQVDNRLRTNVELQLKQGEYVDVRNNFLLQRENFVK